MNAVVLMATPCPKSLHGKGDKWIARNILQGLDSRQPMISIIDDDPSYSLAETLSFSLALSFLGSRQSLIDDDPYI